MKKFIITPVIALMFTTSVFSQEIRRNYFNDGVKVSSEHFYNNGVLYHSNIFNLNGQVTASYNWKSLQNGNWIKETLEDGTVAKRVELALNEGVGPEEASLFNSNIVKQWNFSENEPTTIDIFEIGSKKPSKKNILNEDESIKSEIIYFYKNESERDPYRFEEYQDGALIADYEKYEPFNPQGAWKNLSQSEVEKRQKNLDRKDKFLMAIIDSGFDYNHEDLAHHWHPTMGWDREAGVALPSESTTSMIKNWRPLSHGTHVAHIATRNLLGVGLIGFAGDYTNAEYIRKISAFIKKNKVKVVNMSIGLPSDIRNILGLRDGINAIKKMILDNKETLFVAASGNSIPGVNIDETRNFQYPANINGDNIIKVGSINSDTIEKDHFDDYLMASFSNFGLKYVDILAPGEKVLAASLGGGQISHSGTSMATPYMVNEITRLWQKYPDFNASEMKQIFLDSAYQMHSAPLVISGGFVDREKAEELAKKISIEKRWAYSQSLTQIKDGPNCWNSSLYNAGVTDGLRHVNDYEFREAIESALCQEVESPQFGDIVALRRVNAKGNLHKYSQFSEVHAYTYKDENTGLTKNGSHHKYAYVEETHDEIFRAYDSSSKKDCRILGMPKEHCNLVAKYYRCQTMAGYISNNPFPSDRYLEAYQTLKASEKEREEDSFHNINHPYPSYDLPNEQFSLSSLLEARLNSLKSIFK